MKSLMPTAKVWTVRADTPIVDCVRILRDHAVGALVVLNDLEPSDIVGIFTERDLVKHIELIERGAFWQSPVRSVMTAAVITITPAQISEAPKLMARHHIRHLPVVADEKGRQRLVGVLSMRDVFSFVMQEVGFDLGKIYRPAEPVAREKRRVMAVFSSDPAISDLVEKGSKLTKHFLVKAAPLRANLGDVAELLKRFDALFVDLDELQSVEAAKVLAEARTLSKSNVLFLAFTPARLTPPQLDALHTLATRKRVRLLSKPIALGLLYEQFLRDL